MLNFEDEGALSAVPGLAIAPVSGFMPQGAPGAQQPAPAMPSAASAWKTRASSIRRPT